MAGRASNGESTIYKGADGRWHGYVSVGFTLDGKLDRRHVSSRSRGVVVVKVRELERKARLRDGRRDVDPDGRLVARALAHHHRPAPCTAADTGELRVGRPQAPDPRHRPAPPRPAASGAPRPALHRP